MQHQHQTDAAWELAMARANLLAPAHRDRVLREHGELPASPWVRRARSSQLPATDRTGAIREARS